jgi:hypothetical protein
MLTAPNDDLRAFAREALDSVKEPARARRPGRGGVRRGALQAGHQRRAGQRRGGLQERRRRLPGSRARVHRLGPLVGMPARYVSGYLYTGDASDAASHAWVDVWLGAEIGWQSIDVTHKRPAVRTYCRLAVGRDYLDAAPVRGVRHGGGGEKMEANVLVAESAATAAAVSCRISRHDLLRRPAGRHRARDAVRFADQRRRRSNQHLPQDGDFPAANDRVLVLMSAGNLAITQAVVNLLHEPPRTPTDSRAHFPGRPTCSMRRASWAMRCARFTSATPSALKEHGHEFNGTFILGGQIRGEEPRLFTSTRPAISSNPPSTRRTSRSANRSTASPSSTA